MDGQGPMPPSNSTLKNTFVKTLMYMLKLECLYLFPRSSELCKHAWKSYPWFFVKVFQRLECSYKFF